MGRHRRFPLNNGRVVKESQIGEGKAYSWSDVNTDVCRRLFGVPTVPRFRDDYGGS